MSIGHARRKSVAILSSVAIATVGLSLAPLAVTAASATTSSSLSGQIINDLNAWRVKTEHGHTAKRNIRIDRSLEAEEEYLNNGDISTANPSWLNGIPGGYDGGSAIRQEVAVNPASTAHMANDAIKQLKALVDNGNLADDNYLGIAVDKSDGKWFVDLGAYQYNSPFLPRATAPKVSITGTDKTGSTLTAHSNIAGTSYIWWIGGEQNPGTGTDGETYALQSADANKRVVVWGFTGGTGEDQNAGAATEPHPVEGLSLTTTALTLTGHANVGSFLAVDTSGWGPSGISLTYRWYRGGKLVATDGDDRYYPASADYGHTIHVTVTGELSGYTTTHRSSNSSKTVGHTLLTNRIVPTISRTATVGSLLTAGAGSWSAAGATFTYQWAIAGRSVSKATHSTYTVPSSAQGKSVTVVVTGHRSGYAGTSATSAPFAISPAP
jgi:hypothetical protein